MIPRCNLHTHTTYCDGKASPLEMVQAALTQGLTGLGFSGHSFTSFDDSYCMSREATAAYVDEIRNLQKEYQGRIPIYLGIEQDYFAEPAEYPYDFILGAVHYVEKENRFWDVDWSEARFRMVVEQCFGGDYYAYAQAYYAQVAQLKRKTGCHIVAHLDLLTKFNEGELLFCEGDRRYRDAAFSAIATLCREDVLFELNTGAISRGYRSVPYPSAMLLREICRLGGQVILGSDSHIPDTLLFGFEESIRLVKSCGFHAVVVLTEHGFTEVGIG